MEPRAASGVWTRLCKAVKVTLSISMAYILVSLLCLLAVGKEDPEANDPYIPRSQRGNQGNMVKTWAYQQLMKVAKAIEERIDRMKTRRRVRRAVANVRQRTRWRPSLNFLNNKKVKALVAIAMATSHANAHHTMWHDTDSGPIGIDNRCTACISHVVQDFEGPLVDVEKSIRGFGGSRTTGVKKGTLRWKWMDDMGEVHEFLIPNSYYVPSGGVRLLSPQHLAQVLKDKSGTGEDTNGERCELYWRKRKHKLTIQLGNEDNVATFQLAPGYKNFEAFCAEAGFDDHDPDADPIVFETQVTDDDEADEPKVTADEFGEARQFEPKPDQVEFDLDGQTGNETSNPDIVPDEEDRMSENLPAEFLKIHHRFGHLSFAKLQRMAQKGIIPKKFAKCAKPVCSACMYAKATRRQWRYKNARNDAEVEPPAKPGDVVSVDQLISPTPGLIAQLTGIPTKERYKAATIYVDQVSRASFIYLQKGTTAKETLEGKEAFERWCATYGVTVRAYHADNGTFRAHDWVKACQEKRQPLTFAGVNAHHQNGMAERRIRELQDTARTMLIHANRRWPTAVNAHLWPYALRMANELYNVSPSLQDKEGRSPLQIFSDSPVEINPKHYKPFACPVYVLDPSIQEGMKGQKWSERSRIGIYLGQSPIHSRNVALVLSPTGLVSPQFHVAYDPGFQTVREHELVGTTGSEWMQKCHFPNNITKERDQKPTIAKPKYPIGASAGSGIRSGSTKKRKRVTFEEPMPTSEGGNERAQNPEPMQVSEGDTAPREQADTGQEQDQLQQPEPEQAPILPEQERVTEGRSDQESSDETQTAGRTRSGQKVQSAERPDDVYSTLLHAMTTEIENATSTSDVKGEMFCLQSMFPHREDNDADIYAMKATADPDTMYLHEALREPDRDKFVQAMQKEMDDQMANGNYDLMRRSDVPKGATVLPAVWQMKRKRDIMTRKVKKYKARLNIDGSRMKKGKHYDETYQSSCFLELYQNATDISGY